MKSDLIHAVIDSSHSFWKYLKNPCVFSNDKVPLWKSKLLTNTDASPNHSWLHCCHRVLLSLACLPVCYCWPFAGVIEHFLRFVLSIKLYKSFLHEWFPHFLCLRHLASLDDITYVAKFVRSVRRMGSKGDQWIDCQTSILFYNRIILVFLYWNDVNIYSGLLSLYMHIDIHSCGHRLDSGTTWPSQRIAF